MSGHSKWSTIKRQKGAMDAKRGQTFTKLSRNITIAAKLGGGGDPANNFRLRLAVDQARAVNMPKDNIQRAIDRALGPAGGTQALEEVMYEGFGPGKCAILVEAATDNKLRTNQEVRTTLEHGNGSLGGLGAVSWMFKKLGLIVISLEGLDSQETTLKIMDFSGVEDVEFIEDESALWIYTKPEELYNVRQKLENEGLHITDAELTMKPETVVKISDSEMMDKIMSLMDRLDEIEDVQKVYTNAERILC